MATINEALKQLYLNLGGDASALADNKVISDFIADLENVLCYILPAPTQADNNKIMKVIDGEWNLSTITELPTPTAADNNKVIAVVNGEWKLCTITATADTTTGEVTFTFTPAT